jgi:hypothetical protein
MKLPSTAAFRIPTLIAMALGEIWGVLHFWGDARFVQFLGGSFALWITAAFVLWRNWFTQRKVTFAEFGWLPFAILCALGALREHTRSRSLFWAVLIALVIVSILLRLIAADGAKKAQAERENHPLAHSSEPTAVSTTLVLVLSALIWQQAMEWIGQFVSHPIPLWATIAISIPPLLLMIRVLTPDTWVWFKRRNGAARAVKAATGARP